MSKKVLELCYYDKKTDCFDLGTMKLDSNMQQSTKETVMALNRWIRFDFRMNIPEFCGYAFVCHV